MLCCVIVDFLVSFKLGCETSVLVPKDAGLGSNLSMTDDLATVNGTMLLSDEHVFIIYVLALHH